MKKLCPSCKVEKISNEFGSCQGKNGGYKDGLKYVCKKCEALANKKSREQNKSWVSIQQKTRQTLAGCARSIFQSAKDRAKRKGLGFSIVVDDIKKLYNAQNGKCAITKVTLDTYPGSQKNRNMFKMSLDRIDSTGGYTKSNIQLVCTAVNLAKTNHTDTEFKFWVDVMHNGLFNKDNQQPSIPEWNEGSETISQESTLQAIGNGSARPQLEIVG